MKKTLSGLLLILSMNYTQAAVQPKDNGMKLLLPQFAKALATFQSHEIDPDFDDGSEFTEFFDDLDAIKKTVTNPKADSTLKPQFINSLDTQIDSYEDIKKDQTKISIDTSNELAKLQVQKTKPSDYSKQLQKLSERRNKANAFLANKIEPIIEALKVLRSDIVYKQNNLESTIKALNLDMTKSPERIKTITLADKDLAEAKGVKAYHEAKKALPECCKQKADGVPCKIIKECRGSCDNGIFGNDRCRDGQKRCKDKHGAPAKCEIMQPSYYVDYMERHGLKPE